MGGPRCPYSSLSLPGRALVSRLLLGTRLQAPLARLALPQGFPQAHFPQVPSSVLSWALSDLESIWAACTMAQVTHLGS